MAHRMYSSCNVNITTSFIDETSNKIVSFANLPARWDYGNGSPVSDRIIQRALIWNDFLRLQGLLSTDAFPGTDGEVLVAAVHGKHYIESILEVDGTISIIYDVSGQQQLYWEHGEPEEAKQIIKHIVGQLWSAYAGFTLVNFTQHKTDSPAWLLGTHLSTVGYRLSTSIVSSNLGTPSLITPGHIIQQHHVNRQAGTRTNLNRAGAVVRRLLLVV